ncbi:GH25 family lysozyme [Luteolibacter algae]|uniref:GH25 family lysozyme n=1 Tax=Luteolibacter algae TaxID=454151 RepID=A0ABW5D4L4_9BACT
MKKLCILLIIPLLCHCGGGFGGTSVTGSPSVVNVSGWDPKEVQRSGDRYSQHDVSALRRNGGQALIARSAKGPLLDDKFGDFLKSADRESMMLGAYHFVTMDQDPAAQADSFVSRVRATARAKGISGKKVLLVGDFDTNSTPDRLVKFIERVHQRTGIYPVTYLENSDGLRSRLRNASPEQKRVIRRSPYWLALYGPGGTERTMSRSGALTPDKLTELYDIWGSWSMWQYGGVTWENGRSQPKHYNTSSWRSPTYYGSLAHPLERNVFKGDDRALRAFWERHSISL